MYGRSTQPYADNCFYKVVKPKHKNVKLNECRIYLILTVTTIHNHSQDI